MQKILIIEDDPAIRKQMAQVLRFEGFETLEAANGKLGVASAVSSVPDLIVCDIMMPEMDGFGVLQALRDNPRTAMVPFVFLTALVATHDRRRGMEEGADDYITKPYKPEALVNSVRRRLEKRKRQIEESRLRAEEVSLAVAVSVPQEILETLEHITTVTNLLALKYAAEGAGVGAMHQAVTKESIRLRRMIRRLHLYAQLPQLYANRFELAKTGKLATTAETIHRVAREICQNWKREKDLAVASEPASLPICEEYLVMLVEELVDNACKFSAPGTPIEVKGASQQTFWSLAVSNSGPGMSADQIARIGAFKQFWNGSTKPQGLGLGLALSQGIARLHGCEFTILSSADATTATVLVPLET
ncbi:MAG: response regulator [Verrucomicrobiota bacterium]|jgi:DNA-binding response OmpR family regulator